MSYRTSIANPPNAASGRSPRFDLRALDPDGDLLPDGSPSPRKRILMLNYEFPPLGGGSGNATYYLLDQFAGEPSLEIDLVTSAGGSRFESERFADNIRIFRLPVGKRAQHFWTMSEIARWTWGAMRASRKLCRANEYDLVHCWSGWPSGVVGLTLSRRLPFVVGLRGSDVPGYNERVGMLDRLLFRHLSRVVWRSASSVTAVSEHLRKLARQTAK